MQTFYLLFALTLHHTASCTPHMRVWRLASGPGCRRVPTLSHGGRELALALGIARDESLLVARFSYVTSFVGYKRLGTR